MISNTKGEIPKWLYGVFLRIGPGRYDFGKDFTVNHWFDGFALMHNFIFSNGQVTYRSRYLKSEAYKKAQELHTTIYTEFGTKAHPDFYNNMLHVYQLQGNFYSATETHFIHRIDPITLHTKERVNLNNTIPVHVLSSQPLTDQDGNTYNIGVSFTNIKYVILKFPPKDTLTEGLDTDPVENGSILCQIPFRWKMKFSYCHSFSITKNYIVFLDQPLVMNGMKLIASQVRGYCYKECMDWNPEEKNRFYIIDKANGAVWKTQFITCVPHFALNHINAYEDDGHIVVDIVTYPNAEVLDKLYLNKMRASQLDLSSLPQAQRFVLPILKKIKDVKCKQGENLVKLKGCNAEARVSDGVVVIQPENLGPPGFDMPQINYSYIGKKYKYVYATGLLFDGVYKNGLVKLNVKTKEYKVWKVNEYMTFSEPVFAPHPHACSEDDGLVLTIGLSFKDNIADTLRIFDAKSLTEVARLVANDTYMMDISKLFKNAEAHPDPIEVPIKGVIPDWVRGTYYKIGPGKFDLPSGFTITFRARYVESEAYKRAMAVGKPVFTEFGTKSYEDSSKNIMSRAIHKIMPSDMTDNAQGNLFVMNGRLYAATETCFIRQIDPDTLETKEKFDLWKTVGVNFCSSHYVKDRDGTLYNAGAVLIPTVKYHIFKIPPSLKATDSKYEKSPFRDVQQVGNISSSWKTSFGYNHSIAITDNYIVYVEQPYLVNLMKLITTQIKGKSLKECMDWCPEEKTRFYLVDKKNGSQKKIKYETAAMFFYHFINAYEDGDFVVVDLLAHDTPIMCENFLLGNIRNCQVYETPDHPGLRRFVFPISNIKHEPSKVNLVNLNYTTASAEKEKDDTIALTPECIGEVGFDHPCINIKQCLGRKYRYFYAGGLYGEDTIYRRSVFKMDLQTREVKAWRNAEESIMGEPFFLPNPTGIDEDDGIIIATASDVRPTHRSLLVFLEAKNMTELARVEIPIDIKVLNHAFFLPS
uniref:Uncharacterized protein n=1 Tax=Strigamia maritima TaxID=126957 RepID=T1IVV6_STRMM